MTASSFERWHVDIPPLAERATDSTEWADAIVLVEQGSVDVVCAGGGHRLFGIGCLVALGWLPVTTLRNPTTEMTRLLAVRRRPPASIEGGLPSDPS
jgi:hypothetical protein